MSQSATARTRLLTTWWVLFPSFVVLTFRLASERACGDPDNLLPGLMSKPWRGWAVALVYVAAHLWLVAAYLLPVAHTGEPFPGVRTLRSVWGKDTVKVLLLTAAVAIEFLPVSLWRLLGATLRCAP